MQYYLLLQILTCNIFLHLDGFMTSLKNGRQQRGAFPVVCVTLHCLAKNLTLGTFPVRISHLNPVFVLRHEQSNWKEYGQVLWSTVPANDPWHPWSGQHCTVQPSDGDIVGIHRVVIRNTLFQRAFR